MTLGVIVNNRYCFCWPAARGHVWRSFSSVNIYALLAAFDVIYLLLCRFTCLQGGSRYWIQFLLKNAWKIEKNNFQLWFFCVYLPICVNINIMPWGNSRTENCRKCIPPKCVYEFKKQSTNYIRGFSSFIYFRFKNAEKLKKNR